MKFISILLMTFILNSCGSDDSKMRKFNFTYTVELESTNGKKIELWLPLPQSNTVQEVGNINYDIPELDYEVKTEQVHNNKYLYIYSENGLNKDISINISFDVTRYEHSNKMYANSNPENYLGSYSTVPTGITFSKIIKEYNLNKNDIRGVYDYVLEGMHYGKPTDFDNKYYIDPWLTADGKYGAKEVSRDKVVKLYKDAKLNDGSYTFGNGNSIYACDIGVGNCTDYHSYFMSLTRTLDVPSRFHMGFSIPEGESGKVGGYHCWADYYIENEGWYPVDISEADKNKDLKDYFFGTINKNRFEMMVGRDFKLENYDNGLVNLFIYPILEINDKVSKKYTKSFKFKNL